MHLYIQTGFAVHAPGGTGLRRFGVSRGLGR